MADPDRPRLALALPDDPGQARAAAAALPRLAAVAEVVVVAASPDQAARAIDGSLLIARGPEEVGATLARAQGRTCLLTSGGAEALFAAVDGALVAPLGPGPRLLVRQGVRVVEPGRLDGPALAATLLAARRALVGLGAPRPRLVAFQPDDEPRRSRAVAALEAALAGGAGVEVVGPLAPGRAVLERADALVAWSATQVEVPLALLGSGPTTLVDLGLGQRAAWSDPVDAAGLVAAAERLVAWARAEGPLVAAREAAARPVVTVSTRAAAPGAAASEPRCPFCKRRLDQPPGDEGGNPGPPITCAGCGTAHHRDCLAEHGRCTLLGCESRRGVRLGASVPFAGLTVEAPERRAFVPLEGDAGPPCQLRVEAPIDDPDVVPARRRLELELRARRVRRGDLLEGHVVLHAPRGGVRVRGGVLRIRTTLSTRPLDDAGQPPRTQAILDRQASFMGEAPSGRLGRLQDGVASLFGAAPGLAIPAGVRRWPFAVRIHAEHPATVVNRRGGVEEAVRTTLEAVLDGDCIMVDLDVG